MEYPPLKRLDVEELLNRLEASLAAKTLSSADRVLEFANVLRALRLVHSTDKQVYGLLIKLLKTLKSYKATLGDPNAATLYRITNPKAFAEILPKLEEAVKRLEDANATGTSNGSL